MNDFAKESDLSKRRPKKRRRWFWRTLIALIVLLIVVTVAAQMILSSDIPRRIVVMQVQQKIGLRMTAGAVETGWLGHTTIRHATFSLPLAEQALLEAPTLRVRHSNLFLIILGTFNLNSLILDEPLLHIRQGSGGEWNALQAITLIQRTTDAGTVKTDKPKGPARLPEVIINNGRAEVIDRDNHQTTIDPVTLTARPDGPLVYHYAADFAGRLQVNGQITPTAGWEHQLTFTASQIDLLLRPLIADVPKEINAHGTWTGTLKQDGITSGRLELTNLSTDQLKSSGTARITVSDGNVEVNPQSIRFRMTGADMPETRIVSGSINADATSITVENLLITAYDGQAVVNGTWNRLEHSATLRSAWREIAVNRELNLSGSIDASMTTPWPGHPQIQASFTSTARMPAASVETALKLNGEGTSFNSIDWTTNIDHFTFTGRRSFDVRQVAARLRTRGPQIMLDELRIANRPHLNGRGQYDFAKHLWWFWSQGQDFPVVADGGESINIGFNVNTWGKESFISLPDLFVRAGNLEITGGGFYDSALPKPVNIKLQLSQFPLAGTSESSQLMRGSLTGELQVLGTINPPNLSLGGAIDGTGLALRQRALGDIQVQLEGELSSDGATLRTTEMQLLDGRWRLIGRWPEDRNQPATLDVEARSLPIAEIADLFHQEDLSGSADVQVRFEFPGLRKSQITAQGAFSATDVHAAELTAQRVTGKIDLREGRLRIAPVELGNGAGQATAQIEVPLDQPQQMNVELTLHDWPLQRQQAAAAVSGHTKLSIDLRHRSAAGPLNLEAKLRERDRAVGTLKLEGEIERQTITAKRITADVLGGSLNGNAVIPWNDLLNSRGSLDWSDVDAAAFAGWVPQLQALTGRLSGSAQVGPDNSPHALGPLQLIIIQTPREAQYNGMQIGDSNMVIYFDRDRIVTKVARFHLAGGELNVFARASRRHGMTASSLVTLDFKDLDLDQLVHAGAPQYPESMPGRVAGGFTFGGDPGAPREMFGEGEAHLTQSDLISFDPLGALYRSLRADGSAAKKPTGIADIQMRLEGQNLAITSARIFNRGVEIRGVGTAREIWKVPFNPIEGTAFGSPRAFRNINLPFFSDVDQILNVLASGASTVKIGGTLRNPTWEYGVFAEIGQELRTLIIGDVKEETKGTAGK